MRNKAFTLVEITAVTAIVAGLAAGGVQVVRKGQDARCINNLKQIGQAVIMFEDDMGFLPKAVLFPNGINDSNGIHSILRKYGASSAEIFYCPAVSEEFNKYGTNYIWNEAISGKPSGSAGQIWLMTEVTSLYQALPVPHTGGFGVLYADGSVRIGPRPSLASAQPAQPKEEKPKEAPAYVLPQTPVPAQQQPSQPSEPAPVFKEYQILNLPEKIIAGKPVQVSLKAADLTDKTFDRTARVYLFDFSSAIEPREAVLDKGKATIEATFPRAMESNELVLYDTEGNWTISREFSVTAAPASTIELQAPSIVYAGVPCEVKIILKDANGNIVTPQPNLHVRLSVNVEAECLNDIVSNGTGDITTTIIFHRGGDNKLTVEIKDLSLKETFIVKVRPGAVHHFELGTVKSPVRAGQPVQITIKAVDRWNNRTKGYFVNPSGHLSYAREDTSSGLWLETFTFERAVAETAIVVDDGNGHTGRSNTFTVIPAEPSSISLLDFNPACMKDSELIVPFEVKDRFGNPVLGLEKLFEISGGKNVSVSQSEGHYQMKVLFSEPGLKKITIRLKTSPETSQAGPVEKSFEVLVLPPKPVLKKTG